ncbi:MAG: hypothetical protein ACE5GV_17140 [Candidatus Scalindua sp.]
MGLLSGFVIPMEMGIQKLDGQDSRSTNCGNDRVHHFTRTDKIITDGSGHALGGSAFGTTWSLSPEDGTVGSFKIRPWREPKYFGSIIMIEPAGRNEKKRLYVRMKDSYY